MLARLQDLDFSFEDFLWERKPGQWEVNPLILARIQERIQFDGDVPELRHGNLPEGHVPAVPVETDASHPVLLGRMLSEARSQVQKELDSARSLWEEQNSNLPVPTSPIFAVSGYESGQLPRPRTVPMEPIAAAAMSPQEQQACAFLAFASTQGRVSSLPALGFEILRELRSRGVGADLGSGTRELGRATWTMMIHQAEETNPRFSPIQTAAKVLASKLLRAVPTLSSGYLEVRPINTVHLRLVGFCAILYKR